MAPLEEFDWEEIFAELARNRLVSEDQAVRLTCSRATSTGKIYTLCCFHDERTPSLVFWPNSGFKCHGCGESGRSKQDFLGCLGISEEEIDLIVESINSRSVNQNQLRLL